jgi:hypothetical protein
MGGIIALDGREIDLRAKETEIVSLRRAGHTWEAISNIAGYKNPMDAYRIFQKALTRHLMPKLEELRLVEMDRVDALTLVLWGKAEEGDIKAIETIIKLMERRAKITGLDAPTKIQAEVINYEGGELGEHTRRIIELVRQAGVTEGIMGGDISETGAITGGE